MDTSSGSSSSENKMRSYAPVSSSEHDVPSSEGSNTNCICLRPTNFVFCQSCGAVFKGRCRKVCPGHINTIYLMDNEDCAFCKKKGVLLEIS